MKRCFTKIQLRLLKRSQINISRTENQSIYWILWEQYDMHLTKEIRCLAWKLYFRRRRKTKVMMRNAKGRNYELLEKKDLCVRVGRKRVGMWSNVSRVCHIPSLLCLLLSLVEMRSKVIAVVVCFSCYNKGMRNHIHLSQHHTDEYQKGHMRSPAHIKLAHKLVFFPLISQKWKYNPAEKRKSERLKTGRRKIRKWGKSN